jgi:hypothetical protein
MGFRLAIGPCRCRHRLFPPRHRVLREACKELEIRLRKLEEQGVEALSTVPREHQEVIEFDSGAAHFYTVKVELNLKETLVVLAAAVPTLWFPTYVSTGGIGHIVAEGLVFSSDGIVREAPDSVMRDYR